MWQLIYRQTIQSIVNSNTFLSQRSYRASSPWPIDGFENAIADYAGWGLVRSSVQRPWSTSGGETRGKRLSRDKRQPKAKSGTFSLMVGLVNLTPGKARVAARSHPQTKGLRLASAPLNHTISSAGGRLCHNNYYEQDDVAVAAVSLAPVLRGRQPLRSQ